MTILIVEDQPNDLKIASATAQASGYSGVEARASGRAAVTYLEKGLEGTQTLPDAIVLDLDLGYESGFELLRFWHGEPRLAKIPLVIWTVLGDQYREICRMFKVKAYVYKGDGPSALQGVLSQLSGLAA
jgi:CheY-like chemotaxis protein